MNNKFKFVIVGCGVIANIHALAIEAVDDAFLVGVYDFNINYGRKFAGEHAVKLYESLEEVKKDLLVDFVCICTPSGTHADLAIQMLMAGKNVIVEKPMALTVHDCERIAQAEKESGKTCSVISQLRFSQAITDTKNAIEYGMLGKVVQCGLHMKFHRSAEYYSKSNWRGTWEHDGGGALMNQGIHGVDLLLHLMGNPKSVTAYCRTLHHNIEVEDTSVAIVEFENGALASIDATTGILPGYPRVIEICGTEGSVIIEEDAISKWDIEKSSKETKQTEINAFNDPSAITYLGHKAQFEDAINSVKMGIRPKIDVSEGKRSVELINAIYESSKTNQTIYF